MSALIEVSVHNLYQVVDTLLSVVAQCIRVDGLSIGNTIQSPLVRKLCNRVQGS